MLKKIQTWIDKKQKEQAEKKKLIQLQKYYKVVQGGALFLQFIKQDIDKMKTNQANRHMRRRFEHSLDKFELTEEIVENYKEQIDNVLKYINEQLNPPKAGAVKINKEETQQAIYKTKEK
jgi:hypothetical protein